AAGLEWIGPAPVGPHGHRIVRFGVALRRRPVVCRYPGDSREAVSGVVVFSCHALPPDLPDGAFVSAASGATLIPSFPSSELTSIPAALACSSSWKNMSGPVLVKRLSAPLLSPSPPLSTTTSLSILPIGAAIAPNTEPRAS